MSTTTVPLHQDPHGHGGEHDPHHQHHFTTMEQQFDTSKIGMWLFLVTEVLTFGGLFAGFGLMQNKYPQEFVGAHEELKRWAGSTNTVVLLVSSFTAVMAVLAARTNQGKKAAMYLWITVGFGAVFMCIKAYEYMSDFQEGLYPGKFYSHHGDLIAGSHGYATFFSFYFMMTGLHGLHVLIGMGLMSWLAIRARRGEFSDKYYTHVDLVALFWHLVDMIWIYLFPLYYLIT
jgi:cytochrome c oxidase subunit III